MSKSKKRFRIGLTGIMLIVGAVIFAIYLYFVNLPHVISVIESLDIRIALSTIAIDLFAISLYALSWKFLLKKPGIGFFRAFEVVLVSIFGDLMIPTASISGEILRISLTTKKTKLQVPEATASVLLHRLLFGTTFGIVLGVTIIMLVINGSLTLPFLILFVFLAAACIVLGMLGIYAAFNTQRFRHLLEQWLPRIYSVVKFFRPKYNVGDFRAHVLEGYDAFCVSITCIRKRTILLSALILTLRWFVVALVPYLMFYSLGYPISYPVCVAVAIFTSMVQTIPVGIPGLVGIMEAAMTAFFVAFGVPPTIAASATILTRLVMFWFELSISAVATSLQGVRSIATTREEEAILHPK